MRIVLKLRWLVGLILALSGVSDAKEWRGIVPLHSTREDVTRLLGASPDANNIRAKYFLEKEDVYIVFSGGEFSQECARRLPKDTVLLIEVTPKTNLLLSELQMETGKFRKFDPSSSSGIGYEAYVNEADGIVIRTFKGRVDEIAYVASAQERNRCPEYYGNLEGFLSLIVDSFSVKFDEYGDIPFGDERARLDNFAIQLQGQQDSMAYIIAYAARRARIGDSAARAQRAKTYLAKERGIDVRRIITMDGGHREELEIELFIQKRGLPGPSASPTIEPKDVQIIGAKVKKTNRRLRRTP
jgi:hypothetical protein